MKKKCNFYSEVKYKNCNRNRVSVSSLKGYASKFLGIFLNYKKMLKSTMKVSDENKINLYTI